VRAGSIVSVGRKLPLTITKKRGEGTNVLEYGRGRLHLCRGWSYRIRISSRVSVRRISTQNRFHVWGRGGMSRLKEAPWLVMKKFIFKCFYKMLERKRRFMTGN